MRETVAECIEDLMRKTAGSLGHSFGFYWPADANGRNDPDEANLGFHAAHSLLVADYAVFAEVNHPCPPIQGIDLLAISSGRDHFIAAEFKRHFKCPGMDDSLADVERLHTFWLNRELKSERCGPDPIQVLETCQEGWGLVVGLRWVGIASEDQVRIQVQNGALATAVKTLGGKVADPILVYEYEATAVKGKYYLQYAFFPIATAGVSGR